MSTNDELMRQLDITKSKVFLGSNAAFLGSLMCSLDFKWNSNIPTAQTDGLSLEWNPEWFMSLKPETRKTILVHELWHPARLHMIRRGNRDPKIWNQACDYRINNDLHKEGYSFEGIEWGCLDPSIDQTSKGDLSEEEIYDLIYQKALTPPPQPGNDHHDMVMDDPDPNTQHKIINAVVQAVQQAKVHKQAGSLPGSLEQIIDKFLSPIIDWRILLHKFFTEMLDEDYTWRRPNRRYQDMYLPSRFTDDGRLQHLMYFEDASGSISDADSLRFNSEIKHVKETYNPELMTMVQFDTRITKVDVFKESDPFNEVKIVGRGGTSLRPVRDYIIKHKPTAAIIFSDLYCAPMAKLPYDIPIIWVVIDNKKAEVAFGQKIHIKG